jgi:uncharacterized protein (DUF1330 family)
VLAPYESEVASSAEAAEHAVDTAADGVAAVTSHVIDPATPVPHSGCIVRTRGTEAAMTAYAVGILHEVEMGPSIVEYLECIDATLAPYGGAFVVHGGEVERLEGGEPGALIVIGFPDRAHALDWYGSPAYQAILPLRTEHADSTVFVVDGVGPDHLATDVLA